LRKQGEASTDGGGANKKEVVFKGGKPGLSGKEGVFEGKGGIKCPMNMYGAGPGILCSQSCEQVSTV